MTGMKAFLGEHRRNQVGQVCDMAKSVERRGPTQGFSKVVEEVSHQRSFPRVSGQLDQPTTAPLMRRATRHTRLSVFPGWPNQGVQRASMSKLVLRDRRQCEVFFEERRQPKPFGMPVTDDEFVVGQRQQRFECITRKAACGMVNEHRGRIVVEAAHFSPRR